MSLIVYLNELIEYSMGFPFYQQLNPLFNGISNKDTLYQLVEAFWRAGAQGPGPGPRDPRAKMLRPLDKGASLLDFPFNNEFNP